FETTVELADVVAGAVGRRNRGRRNIHPATRTFQALRIAVNGELDNVEAGIRAAIGTLRQGGRLVVISYHSLEDRLVKTLLREESKPVDENRSPTLRLITKRVMKPETSEIEANPRSRSARMRVAERL
ncbi:MAG: 16S rRNA (cytosine(1402)-N(4))-methyltransferase, partial [Dehalococcoidia bacterium]|nr:16S rRNA (cytosine(1402)-N(4))-methyltransferase [Dehalococcoidia bacterium]